MASKNPHEATPSESEGETLALHIRNKRARRVSFADTEITSVHIFRRDDEYETPPESKPSPPAAVAEADSHPDDEVLGFFRDLGSDSDDSVGEDDGSVDVRKSFLRPVGSPSPGGSGTAGTASPDNEDNIFGPVSSSFIRPGWLTDSGVSDDIHEETLDTTAFSLHYRSLARSDSGEVQTPTVGRLAVEEKTTTKDTNPTDSGSLMALTDPKRLIPQSLVPPEKVRSGQEDSDDMSIVDENPKKYDFEMLSPTLDALLEEGSRDLKADSVALPISPESANGNEALTCDQMSAGHVEGRNDEDSKLGHFDALEKFTEVASISDLPRDPNAGFADLITFDNLPEGGKSLIEEDTIANLISRLDSNAPQSDTVPQHELADRHLNKSSAIENSPRLGQHNTDADCNFDRQLGSPPSTTATRQPVFHTPKSVRGSDRTPPFLRQADLQSNGRMKLDENNSGFRSHDHSYYSSSIKQGTDKLKQRLSKYSSISSPFGSALQEYNKDLQSKYMGTPVAGPKEQLFNAKQKNDNGRSLVSLDMNQVETPRSTNKLGKKDGAFPVVVKDPPNSMSSNVLSNDKANRLSTSLLSTFNLISPGSKGVLDAMISEDSKKTMFLSSGTNSSMMNDEEIEIPRLHLESETLKSTQSLGNKVNLNFQQERSERNVQSLSNVLLSTPDVSRTSVEPPTSEDPGNNEATPSQSGKVTRQDPEGETPDQKAARRKQMGISSAKPPLRRSPRNLRSSPLTKEPTLRSRKKVTAPSSPGKESTPAYPRIEPLPVPCSTDLTRTPLGNKANQSTFKRDRIESPSGLDQSDAMLGSNTASPCKKAVGSPQFSSDMDGRDNICQMHVSESPLCTNDANISAKRKRGNAAVILEDGKWARKSPRIQKSQHNLENGNIDSVLVPDRVIRSSDEKDKNDGDRARKHWLGIFRNFSWDVERLLSRSTNVLNFEATETLEDILNDVMKVKNYEMLYSDIQSQKGADQFSLKHKKRIAETRFLLCKIAFEKAKLLLRCEKRDKLQNKVLLLKSGIRECQILKSKYIQQSKIGRSDTQHGDYQLQSSSVNLDGEHQVASVTVDKMKQDIKALDGKINDFSKLFQKYCKIQGESNYGNTLASIQNHLMRRNRCRLIRQELQLWKIGSFECQNGQFNILLNYQGYLSQRFTLTSGSVSTIIITNQLNDVSVLKTFPNIEALVAFAFVYNVKVAKRGVDLKCLVQETQVTQSLMCNLLDVIDEVQMAQIEIGNLVQANFYCPSGHQLDLQLYFINFRSGVKVTLTLDVTCLSSGIYPSETIPYKVQIARVSALKSKSLSDEIIFSAENLEAGYFRIMRLCRCVSHLLQD